MDYLSWNDLLIKHYFDSSMAGREVLLYVNSEVIETLGQPYGCGVDNFVETVKKGPGWVTKSRLCQRALQAYDHWRDRGLEYPPYGGYLVLFVLAAVTETDYAPHSYYPGLRKLLGESQDAGMPFQFDSMIYLWNDLEKWSREDKPYDLRDMDGRPVSREEAKKIIMAKYQVPEEIRRERRRRKITGNPSLRKKLGEMLVSRVHEAAEAPQPVVT